MSFVLLMATVATLPVADVNTMEVPPPIRAIYRPDWPDSSMRSLASGSFPVKASHLICTASPACAQKSGESPLMARRSEAIETASCSSSSIPSPMMLMPCEPHHIFVFVMCQKRITSHFRECLRTVTYTGKEKEIGAPYWSPVCNGKGLNDIWP